ncbi:hypothetical protein STS98_000346 [Cronobacter sakazakii]|nr:hypothetical protein [Cronobacter sakazakii]ELY2893585.1 hypothetical protein [Cronobacter sakazakii]ELZ1645016.1 hypothetical protein [Cronobacter sakazakii]
MLDQVLAFIKIRQELPDAIGYSLSSEQSIFDLPEEILKACGEELSKELNHLSCVYLRIDNYTNNVQKSIRVLLAGESDYTPRVQFRRRNNRVTHETLPNINEILIHEIPPNDSVYITFYNPSENFSIEQILVDDKTITPSMRRLAEIKRDPWLAKMKFSFALMFLFSIIAIIGSLSLVTFTFMRNNQEQKIFDDAFKGMSLCQNEIFHNSIEKEKELERRFYQLGLAKETTLMVNHVSSLEELKLKDTIILCVPIEKP